jgi:hypothetical protein
MVQDEVHFPSLELKPSSESDDNLLLLVSSEEPSYSIAGL